MHLVETETGPQGGCEMLYTLQMAQEGLTLQTTALRCLFWSFFYMELRRLYTLFTVIFPF